MTRFVGATFALTTFVLMRRAREQQRRLRPLVLLALTFGLLSVAPQAARPPQAGAVPAATPATRHQAEVAKYCVTCHNDRLKTSGVSFEKIKLADVGDQAEVWEKAVRKLRGGMMPPQGA